VEIGDLKCLNHAARLMPKSGERYIIAAIQFSEDIPLPLPNCFVAGSASAIPLHLVGASAWPDFLAACDARERVWIESQGFVAETGSTCVVPGADGAISHCLVGLGDGDVDTWSLAAAVADLPATDYRLEGEWSASQRQQMAVGWAAASYRFERYRAEDKPQPRLNIEGNTTALEAEVNALYRVRDLINTPPNDMMPEALSAQAAELAAQYGAVFSEIVGDALLQENYPTIHMVGRASRHAPRLLELRWGEVGHPHVVLVGKGVCFDTGGLDLKPANAMRLMQKDMGGAAHVLGLAEMVMANQLPVDLRVLVPAVDNAVSGDAFRPGDIVTTRKGLTVEVDNTDAEGRLVLCDALAEACDGKPDLLLDFATLTGSARSAVGTEIAAYFSNRDALADAMLQAGETMDDPVWRLPLHAAYDKMLKSRFADLVNCASSPYAGAIVAALFLQRFVDESVAWLHVDMMAWNTSARPGHPEGGESMGVRAAFELLRRRYQPANRE
jgi:leucyl aminopeptidase